jgi:gliding motility-associated-like protein
MTQTVIVKDSIVPIVTCKDTTVYLNGLGQVTIDTSYVFLNATDNCGVDSIWIITNTFNCSNIGVQPVQIYARDLCNNIDSCTANLTVLDTLNPTVVCNDTTVYLNTSGQFIIDTSFIYVSSNDNCAVDSIWTNDTLYDCSTIGINTATIYVRDVNGNIDSCISNVTAIDSLNPIIGCNDTTVYLSSAGTYSIDTSYVFTNAIDNCGVDSIWMLDTNFTCLDTGINSVTVYTTDVNGNIDSCISQVTIIDTLNPIVICQDTTIYLSSTGTFTIDTSYVLASLSDNCGIDSVWLTPTSFTCSDTGLNTVTIYAKDVNNNIDSCMANVIVLDTVNPTVSCMNATIYLDTNGQFIIDTSYVYTSSFAGCGLDSIWIIDSVFDCSRIGLNIVSVYARGINGNIDSCQANVTVVDSINPIIGCNTTLYDTVTNSCDYTVADFRSLIMQDNCTDSINFLVAQNPLPGTIINISDQLAQNIIITVTDTNGNQSICMFNVEITCEDELQIPEFISPNEDGKNDTWIITGIEAYPNNGVKVFNRYGVLVYETKNYDNTWGGESSVGYIFQTGKSDGVLPDGTYYYQLILDTGNTNSDNYRGIIQIEK